MIVSLIDGGTILENCFQRKYKKETIYENKNHDGKYINLNFSLKKESSLRLGFGKIIKLFSFYVILWTFKEFLNLKRF